jgi:ATP-dependent Lhr-like helicase
VFTKANHGRGEEVVAHMLATRILVEDTGVLGMGSEGEAKFGRRYFQELVAAFTTPLLLAVRHGSNDLGSIDPLSLETQRTSAPVILLGGRSWRVLDVDWPRRVVSVEPAAETGRSRWFGSSRALHAELVRTVERVLATGECGIGLSSRAQASLDGLREKMPYIDGESLPIVATGDEYRLWTFAGGRANAMLANALRNAGIAPRVADNFGVLLRQMDQVGLAAAIDSVNEQSCRAPVDARMLAELKFGICLPERLAKDVLRARLSDFGALQSCLKRSRRWISIPE